MLKTIFFLLRFNSTVLVHGLIHGKKKAPFLLSSVRQSYLSESYCTSPNDKCQDIWLTVNCRWQSGFFLSWTGACNIYYLCPLQPLRNKGPCFCVRGHGSSIRQHITLCLCKACWELLGDSVIWAEVEGFLQPAAWLPACPLLIHAQWTLIPQQRHRVPGRGKQIHLVASNNHSAPVGTGRGKLIVCLQRLDIVNVFAIDGVR